MDRGARRVGQFQDDVLHRIGICSLSRSRIETRDPGLNEGRSPAMKNARLFHDSRLTVVCSECSFSCRARRNRPGRNGSEGQVSEGKSASPHEAKLWRLGSTCSFSVLFCSDHRRRRRKQSMGQLNVGMRPLWVRFENAFLAEQTTCLLPQAISNSSRLAEEPYSENWRRCGRLANRSGRAAADPTTARRRCSRGSVGCR